MLVQLLIFHLLKDIQVCQVFEDIWKSRALSSLSGGFMCHVGPSLLLAACLNW